MTQQSWPEKVAATAAGAVRRHRERRGLSAQQLSEECAKLGMPIARSVIANFENGRRSSVGVAEILIFAAVLQVPPVELICPTGYDQTIEILPGEFWDPYLAASWITGENSREEDPEGPDELPYFRTPLALGRQLLEAQMGVQWHLERYAEAEKKAASKRSDLERAKARQEELRAAYEGLRAKVVEKLQVIESGDLPSEDLEKEMALAQDLNEASRRALDELTAADSVAHELGYSQLDLQAVTEGLREEEKAARDLIAQIRKEGWELPPFPPELQYLLEEEKGIEKPRRLARKTGRA